MRPSNQRLRELNQYLKNKSDEDLTNLVDTILSCGYEWIESHDAFFSKELGKGVKTSGLDFFTPETFLETHEEWKTDEWKKITYYNKMFYRSIGLTILSPIIFFVFYRWEIGVLAIVVGIVVIIYSARRKDYFLKQRDIKKGDYVDTSKIEWCLTCKHFSKVRNYEDDLHLSEEMLPNNQIPCKILTETKPNWELYFKGNLDDR